LIESLLPAKIELVARRLVMGTINMNNLSGCDACLTK